MEVVLGPWEPLSAVTNQQQGCGPSELALSVC